MYDHFMTFLIILQMAMTMFQDFKSRVGLPVTRPALNQSIELVDMIVDIFYMIEAVIKVALAI